MLILNRILRIGLKQDSYFLLMILKGSPQKSITQVFLPHASPMYNPNQHMEGQISTSTSTVIGINTKIRDLIVEEQ